MSQGPFHGVVFLLLVGLQLGCPCPPLKAVRGQLVDQRGTPVVGVSVHATRGGRSADVTSDSEGRFDVSETDETASGERCLEEQRLEFEHPACHPAEETMGQEGAESANRQVALTCCPSIGGLELVGRITDAAGQPFEGAVFRAYDAYGINLELAGRSAADGSFRLRYEGPSPVPRLRGGAAADAWCVIVIQALRDGVRCQASTSVGVQLDAQPGDVVAVPTMAMRCL